MTIGPTTALRDIHATDALLMAALHAESMDIGWSAETFAGLLALPGTFGLLAVRGEDPAGFVLARAGADEAEILALAVTNAWRRQGMGRALLTAAKRVARTRGARRLFLEVSVENASALALYLTSGFVEVGRRKGYYARRDAPAIDALILSSTLDEAGG
jgi:ribosomal-protein-alanine N-acetyltransferase